MDQRYKKHEKFSCWEREKKKKSSGSWCYLNCQRHFWLCVPPATQWMSHLGLQLYLPCPCPAQTGALRIKVAFCLGNWTLLFSETNHVIDVHLLTWKDAHKMLLSEKRQIMRQHDSIL